MIKMIIVKIKINQCRLTAPHVVKPVSDKKDILSYRHQDKNVPGDNKYQTHLFQEKKREINDMKKLHHRPGHFGDNRGPKCPDGSENG